MRRQRAVHQHRRRRRHRHRRRRSRRCPPRRFPSHRRCRSDASVWLRLCAPSETPAATVGNGFALEWGILFAGAALGVHGVRLGRPEAHRCAFGQVCVPSLATPSTLAWAGSLKPPKSCPCARVGSYHVDVSVPIPSGDLEEPYFALTALGIVNTPTPKFRTPGVRRRPSLSRAHISGVFESQDMILGVLETPNGISFTWYRWLVV